MNIYAPNDIIQPDKRHIIRSKLKIMFAISHQFTMHLEDQTKPTEEKLLHVGPLKVGKGRIFQVNTTIAFLCALIAKEKGFLLAKEKGSACTLWNSWSALRFQHSFFLEESLEALRVNSSRCSSGILQLLPWEGWNSDCIHLCNLRAKHYANTTDTVEEEPLTSTAGISGTCILKFLYPLSTQARKGGTPSSKRLPVTDTTCHSEEEVQQIRNTTSNG